MTPAQVVYWEDVFLKLSFNSEWLQDLRTQWWESAYLNSSETRQFLAAQYVLMKGALTELGLGK